MNPTTEQKIREIPKSKFNVGDAVSVRCVEAECPPFFDAVVCAVSYSKNRVHYYDVQDASGVTTDYTEDWLTTRHFGQPEQPAKSLDEIVEKYAEGSTLEIHTRTSSAIRKACLEYASTQGDEAAEIYRKAWLKALDAQNADPHLYFKVHEVGRPLPIDTEILLDDGRWVEACSWPQYDATINYQARVKKGTK